MKHLFSTLAVAGLVAGSASLLQAQPYYIAGDFINNWQNDATFDSTNSQYQLTGGPSVYTYTISGGTPGSPEQMKIIPTAGQWGTTYPANNLYVNFDANGSNTIYLYPGTITDGWTPVQNRVGYADPGNMTWEIAGDFNGFNGGPGYQLISNGAGVYTNSITIPTAGTYQFKFRTSGTWNDANFGTDFGNGGGNASLTTTTSPQTVLIQLDLPHGRWVVGQPVLPVTNTVVFAVDMSAQTTLGDFNPASDAVMVSGAFNGWPGTAAGALVLTNFPTYNGGSNTNIYYGSATFIGTPNSAASDYKFTSTASADSGSSGYEPRSNNRTVSLGSSSGTLLLPVVKFGDVNVSDYSVADLSVTFTVNMTNATSIYDGHVFNPATDSVFLNGNFVAGGWASWNPIALIQMQNDPIGSDTYTATVDVPPASLINLDYKYSMGYPGVTNYDDEGGFQNDHHRYLRTITGGTYNLAQDTFGNQYSEPNFGQLTATTAGAGHVSVNWLGRPGVQLQASASALAGWQTLSQTDGTNWSNGFSSTNGFVSQTNYPAVGNQFFRLIQAW